MRNDSYPSARLRSRWGKPVLVMLLLLSVLVAFPFVLRTYVLTGIPEIGPPFEAASFNPHDVPVNENAYTYYHRASDLLIVNLGGAAGGSVDRSDAIARCYSEGWQHADDDVKNLLEANRPALESWRLGAAQTEARYHNPRKVRFDTLLTVDQNLRGLNSWALVEAARLATEGKTAESWEWIDAAFRSSRHLGSFGCLISRLVGAANHAASTQAALLWAGHPQVTQSELRAALDDVEASYARTPTNVEVLQTEFFRMKNCVVDIFSGKTDPSALGTQWSRTSVRPVAYLRGEPERSLRLIDHYFANQLPHTDKPRPQRPPLRNGHHTLFDELSSTADRKNAMSPEELDTAIYQTTALRLAIPAMEAFYDAVDRELARHQCLRVALAAQAFYRAQGRFPETLQELVPEYLSEVPTDPFSADGAPLCLKKEQDRLRIYSVSLNGVDDGGTKIVSRPGTNSPDEGIELQAPDHSMD